MDLNELQDLRQKIASIVDGWENDLKSTIASADDEEDNPVIVRSIQDMVDIGLLEFAVGIKEDGINRLDNVSIDEVVEKVSEPEGDDEPDDEPEDESETVESEEIEEIDDEEDEPDDEDDDSDDDSDDLIDDDGDDDDDFF